MHALQNVKSLHDKSLLYAFCFALNIYVSYDNLPQQQPLLKVENTINPRLSVTTHLFQVCDSDL